MHYSTFPADYNNKATWVGIAVISSNTLVTKIMGGWLFCLFCLATEKEIYRAAVYDVICLEAIVLLGAKIMDLVFAN